MTRIGAIDHVSLTVRDLACSTAWYCQVLGFEVAREVAGIGFRRAILTQPASRSFVGLTQHESNDGEPFAENRAGMDHMALRVDSLEELASWKVRLVEQGVAFSTPRADLIVLRDPDNIQLELYFPS